VEGSQERVAGVQDERLSGRDDGLDVLEVDDDGALANQDGGGGGEVRVEHAEVARGHPRLLVPSMRCCSQRAISSIRSTTRVRAS